MFWIVLIGAVLYCAFAMLDVESDGMLLGLLLKAGFWIAIIVVALFFVRGC